MKHCLNSISFSIFGVIIFISETISLIMNILLLIKTSWNFLKKTIKILNIICISVISLSTIINIIFFSKINNIKKEIFQKYTSKIASIIFLIIIYLLIIIFSIFNSIYLSIHLHIADYPEYGGRERDQNYIDSHPNEFGNVSDKEFIIVAVCPSIICIFNVLCVIISFLMRNKIILIYHKTREKYHNNINIESNKNKSKNHKHHKNSEHKMRKRNSTPTNNFIIKTSNELMNTNNIINTNNSSVIIDRKNKLKDKNEEIIKIQIDNSEKKDNEDDYKIKFPKKENVSLNSLDSNENNNNAIRIKEYNEELPEKFYFGEREINTIEECKNKENELNLPFKRYINSKQGTKSTINYKIKKEKIIKKN